MTPRARIKTKKNLQPKYALLGGHSDYTAIVFLCQTSRRAKVDILKKNS